MLSRSIVNWIIICLPSSIAVYIAMNNFILPYFKAKHFKAKQTQNVNDPEVIPSQVDAQIEQLRQQIDSLLNEIDEFGSESESSFPIILTGDNYDEVATHLHKPSYMRNINDHDNETQFIDKFSQRIMNILYFLNRRGIISQREWEDFNRITQPNNININKILSMLKEYRVRLR